MNSPKEINWRHLEWLNIIFIISLRYINIYKWRSVFVIHADAAARDLFYPSFFKNFKTFWISYSIAFSSYKFNSVFWKFQNESTTLDSIATLFYRLIKKYFWF